MSAIQKITLLKKKAPCTDFHKTPLCFEARKAAQLKGLRRLLKLDEKVKLRNFSGDIHRHLHAEVPSADEKWIMFLFVILFLDLICGIPLFVNGKRIFTILASPLIVLINLWTCIVMFLKSSFRNDLHFTLFKGSAGAVVSICYFVLSQKYAFSILGFNFLFMSSSLLTYIIVILGLVRHYLIVLPDYKRKEKNAPVWGTYLFTLGPAIGYMAAQFIFHFSDSVVNLFMSFIYLMLGCTFSYFGVKFIHKFFFIRANQNIIDRHLYKGINRDGRK
ncbi:hypothetical protein [Bacillus haynesii]|uniref:hypothetical protein n=1 Tax=Bacillus haynesii TaxID=1925021 RepID=UPI00227E7F37|nr:hypothetical protein [Bacillus haynesii]MCY8384310.1 hypothetical protein [Bacillus haynesii]MCY9369659.1 hypothetical protein [Bacillus haynesii]MEC0700936.1 hypothetical protein [Bacillus haynesii]